MRKKIPNEIEINGVVYFTKNYAAAEIGIHPVTLQRIANGRQISCFKHPSYGLCFTRDNLKEWVNKRTQHAR